MKFIDLSRKIEDKMPVYPGDENTYLKMIRKLECDGYNLSYLETGMHAGTHIDVPMHLINSNKYISDYPLERFIGEACLIDARNKMEIEYKDIYEKKVRKNDIVLVYTAHDNFFGRSEYFEKNPVISEKSADFFIKKKVKMVGIDAPSPDRYPFNIHKKLFLHDILIIENLTNLNELLDYDRFQIVAFPLNIDSEASITRVVACIL